MPLLCFADNDSSKNNYLFNRTIDSLIEFGIGCIFYSGPFIAALFLFGSLGYVVFAPILLREKIKKYCQNNNLQYVKETNELPDGYMFKFIDIKCKYSFTDLMIGKRLGVSFILGDCYLNYSSGSAKVSKYFTFLLFKSDNFNSPYFYLKNEIDLEYFKRGLTLINCKHTSMEAKFSKNISFYQAKNLLIKEDEDFSEKLEPVVDDIESAEIFFNENRRKLFLKYYPSESIYEGKDNNFVIVKTNRLLSFKDRLSLLEKNLSLFINISK